MFIADYLLNHSAAKEQEIEQKLAENKTKTGYVINETPGSKGDQLFEAIIDKYKGKVVFVDFWATWCGPCRSGMEQMKPLKEELKDTAIEFVYITNQTSPLDTWNMMVPDIKGEHYRVEQDEWNLLASRFNISGIPQPLALNLNDLVFSNRHLPVRNLCLSINTQSKRYYLCLKHLPHEENRNDRHIRARCGRGVYSLH